MPCYYPIVAYRTDAGEIVFTERAKRAGDTITLPCGRCIGCRLERSRQWAVRCMHEAKLYDANVFITLTYDDDHLPPDRSLLYPDFQKFMKRLRRRFSTSTVRFYMCGEYGEGVHKRPHYHACVFNCHFPDKLYFSSDGDSELFTSDILTELWGKGFALVGNLTFQSAAYVARYCLKKVTGVNAAKHYEVIDEDTGEIRQRVPEFARMSLKPGIGGDWIKQFMPDCYPKGEVVVNGKAAKAPRYYDKKFKETDDTDRYQLMMEARARTARQSFAEQSDHRLAVKEVVTEARLAQFKRKL